MLYIYYSPATPTTERTQQSKNSSYKEIFIKLPGLGEIRASVDSEGLHINKYFSDIVDFQEMVLTDALLPYVSRVSFKDELPQNVMRQDGVYTSDNGAKLTLLMKHSPSKKQTFSLMAPTLQAAQALLQKLLDGNILPDRPVSAERQLPSHDALAALLPPLRLVADRLADQLLTADRVLAYSSELLRQNHAAKESLLTLLKKSGVAVPKDLLDAVMSC